MSEHEASPRAPSAPLHWRVRACRWLWRGLCFVWGTLIVGIVIGTIANLNTTTTDIPLTKLYIVHLAQTYLFPIWSSLGLLAMLTLLSWLGSRDKQATPVRSRSEQNRIHMLRRLRMRYEQLLAQSLDEWIGEEIAHLYDVPPRSHALESGMRTNRMEKGSAFSSRLLTRPAERIQSTCYILWRKNY